MADRRAAGLAALLLPALLVSGCAGMPSSGAVHLGRAVSVNGGLGDLDVRVLPPAPFPGMSPGEVVNGFLHALVNDDGDYLIARTYLTPAAAAGWDAGAGVTTYDDGSLRVTVPASGGARRTVTVTANRIGTVDRRGDYTPKPGTLALQLGLVRVRGEWRIDRLPAGVPVSTLDAQRSLRLADVYYVNPAGTAVVPEQVLLHSNEQGVATALLKALLSGPGGALAPAVRTAAPRGTTLLGTVPIDTTGTADVNLSAAARQASSADLQLLAAQVVWTLRQVTGITAVRLQSDGSPLPVPGVAVREPVTAWSSLDPASGGSNAGAYVSAGGAVTLGAAPAGFRAAVRAHDLAVALAPDGSSFALVRPAPRAGVQLLVGHTRNGAGAVLDGRTLTPPTFDRDGDVFTVVDDAAGRRVVEVTLGGQVRPVSADPPTTTAVVQQLRLSPDGTRVAVVSGRTGSGRLLVGRVGTSRGQVTFSSFRAILPAANDVRGVAWLDGSDLAVTAAGPAGAGAHRQVLEVDVDGYEPRALPADAIGSPPVDVAATTGQPLLVATAAGDVWSSVAGRWQRLGAGRAPAYAG